MRSLGYVTRGAILLLSFSTPCVACGSGPHLGTKALPYQADEAVQIVTSPAYYAHSFDASLTALACGVLTVIAVGIFLQHHAKTFSPFNLS